MVGCRVWKTETHKFLGVVKHYEQNRFVEVEWHNGITTTIPWQMFFSNYVVECV